MTMVRQASDSAVQTKFTKRFFRSTKNRAPQSSGMELKSDVSDLYGLLPVADDNGVPINNINSVNGEAEAVTETTFLVRTNI
jgi:hypothetical protein